MESKVKKAQIDLIDSIIKVIKKDLDSVNIMLLNHFDNERKSRFLVEKNTYVSIIDMLRMKKANIRGERER